MRKIASIVLSLGIMTAALAGCTTDYPRGEFTSYVGKTGTLVPAEVLEKAGLQFYWQSQKLPLRAGEGIREMFVRGENVYFITDYNNLYAVDAATGIFKWSQKITDNSETIYPPTHFNAMRITKKVGGVEDILNPPSPAYIKPFDAVVINTTTRIVVLDRKTGDIYRDFSYPGFSATCRGITDGHRFFTGTTSNLFYATKLLTATNIWHKDTSHQPVKVPVKKMGSRLYIGTHDGLLKTITSDDIGLEGWSRKLDGGINHEFALDGRGLFVACDDGFLYGLDHNGKNIWEPVNLRGYADRPIQMTDNSLLQHVPGQGLVAIKITEGEIRWKLPKAIKAISSIDGKLYVIDRQSNLQAVNEITGEVATTVPLTGVDFVAPALQAEAIYVATRDGRVYCIRSKNAEKISAEMLKELMK